MGSVRRESEAVANKTAARGWRNALVEMAII
jgi:hypothetical protein